MELPQSPSGAGMVPSQDGHSPNSPPPPHRHADPSMYRQPPPGSYGPPPPGYPGYPPYGGGPTHTPYGFPAHGYPRGPPGSFPPGHHSPSYPYGYGAGHRPPYYGFEGYPGQQPPHPSAYRNGPGAMPPSQQPPHQSSSPTKGGSPQDKTSPTRSHELPLRAPKIADHVEVERLRAAAATELTHDEVKPIQTDFHFFAKEHAAKFRKLAEDDVRKSSDGGKLDPFLINSNMNTRLMKAWENLKKEDRDSYMSKEEADRRRFMEEDEVASRHCATLTARGKSPKSSDKKADGTKKQEERQESDSESPAGNDQEMRVKKEENEGDGEGNENSSEDSDHVEENNKKRDATPPSDDSSQEDRGSPTKKTRAGEETGTETAD